MIQDFQGVLTGSACLSNTRGAVKENNEALP